MTDEISEEDFENVVPLPSTNLGNKRPGINPGGGGGGMNGLEPRVAKLEAHMEHVLETTRSTASDMKNARERLATLEEKVDHLPSKEYIVKTVVGTGAVLGVLTIFGPKIASILGIT